MTGQNSQLDLFEGLGKNSQHDRQQISRHLSAVEMTSSTLASSSTSTRASMSGSIGNEERERAIHTHDK